MSQTESDRSEQRADALFEAVLVPLAHHRRSQGAQAYFQRWKTELAATYFVPSPVRSMTARDFEFPGDGTPAGLLDALSAIWIAEGEMELAASVPQLRLIADALRNEAARNDGEVDIFCYTLF
jgi:hypothetical protein